jgi:hypothetical protein
MSGDDPTSFKAGLRAILDLGGFVLDMHDKIRAGNNPIGALGEAYEGSELQRRIKSAETRPIAMDAEIVRESPDKSPYCLHGKLKSSGKCKSVLCNRKNSSTTRKEPRR